MKSFLLVLLFLFGCGQENGPGDEKETPDLFSSPDSTVLVPTTEKIVTRTGSIELARKKAHELIRAAGQRARTPEERQSYQSLDAALSRAKIEVPSPGHDLKACVQERGVLAFVNLLNPNVIHVCARAAAADTRHLSQVLIHETAHVAGIHDECNATKIEVGVIRRAGEHIAFRNGYMKRCGIR